MTRYRCVLVVAAVAGSFLFCSVSGSQGISGFPASEEYQTLKIENAEKWSLLDGDPESLEGNVHLVLVPVEPKKGEKRADEIVIKAEKITFLYKTVEEEDADTGKKKTTRIRERIVLEKNVSLVRGDSSITAGKATWTAKDNVVEFQNSPEVRDRGSVLTPEVIYHDIDDNRTWGTGGTGPLGKINLQQKKQD